MYRLVNRVHRWIALVVGLQVVGWVLGGLVMTAIPIGLVRGEAGGNHARHLAPLDLAQIVPLERQLALAEKDELAGAVLRNTPRGPIWVLQGLRGDEAWYDAYTGENVEEITADQIRAAAESAYSGSGRLVSVVYLDVAPPEALITGQVWQAGFDDWQRTTYYMDTFTGELLSRRSHIWRLYDFFYQIHIMNFSADRSYNHAAIVIAAAATLLIVITGVILLWIRIGGDLKMLWKGRGLPAGQR